MIESLKTVFCTFLHVGIASLLSCLVSMHILILAACVAGPLKIASYPYCIAHVSWDVTGYQGLLCPSNKPFSDR